MNSINFIKRLGLTVFSLAVLLALFSGCTRERGPQDFQYAAKIICTSDIPGTSQTAPGLLPGVYETVVNIHNPTYKRIKFRMKVATSGGVVSRFISRELKADQAMAVNCTQIAREFGLFSIHGIEGFLVIESNVSLDVTAVYTAGQVGREVTSIDVEVVKERRVKIGEQPPGSPDLVPVPNPACGNEPICYCDREGDSLCVTIKNVGDAAAGASHVTLDFGSFGSVTKAIPALGPGDQTRVCFPIPPGCFDPDCNFRIIVDPNGTVNESNENNNSAAGICIG